MRPLASHQNSQADVVQMRQSTNLFCFKIFAHNIAKRGNILQIFLMLKGQKHAKWLSPPACFMMNKENGSVTLSGTPR